MAVQGIRHSRSQRHQQLDRAEKKNQAAEPDEAAKSGPAMDRHDVQQGETVWGIARAKGLQSADVLKANPNLKMRGDVPLIGPGMTLNIPAKANTPWQPKGGGVQHLDGSQQAIGADKNAVASANATTAAAAAAGSAATQKTAVSADVAKNLGKIYSKLENETLNSPALGGEEGRKALANELRQVNSSEPPSKYATEVRGALSQADKEYERLPEADRKNFRQAFEPNASPENGYPKVREMMNALNDRQAAISKDLEGATAAATKSADEAKAAAEATPEGREQSVREAAQKTLNDLEVNLRQVKGEDGSIRSLNAEEQKKAREELVKELSAGRNLTTQAKQVNEAVNAFDEQIGRLPAGDRDRVRKELLGGLDDQSMTKEALRGLSAGDPIVAKRELAELRQSVRETLRPLNNSLYALPSDTRSHLSNELLTGNPDPNGATIQANAVRDAAKGMQDKIDKLPQRFRAGAEKVRNDALNAFGTSGEMIRQVQQRQAFEELSKRFAGASKDLKPSDDKAAQRLRDEANDRLSNLPAKHQQAVLKRLNEAFPAVGLLQSSSEARRPVPVAIPRVGDVGMPGSRGNTD